MSYIYWGVLKSGNLGLGKFFERERGGDFEKKKFVPGKICKVSQGGAGIDFGHLKSEVFWGGWGGWGGNLVIEICAWQNLLSFSMGGYSGVNFGHLKSEVFLGGGNMVIEICAWQNLLSFSIGGVFWSKLWSPKI